MHLSPGGYRLLDVGLNPRRLAVHREWYRLLSSPVLHSSLPHLASNLGGLMVEGSELEARVGSAAMLGLVASVGALSQAIYGESFGKSFGGGFLGAPVAGACMHVFC